MNEREKVYDLISEYVIQYLEWMNKGVELPRLDLEEVVDQIDALYDALYSEREKQMWEALEWACNVIKYDTECNLSKYGCKYCPIKQGREGK